MGETTVTDKKVQTKAGATQLNEQDLDGVQGGFSWGDKKGNFNGKDNTLGFDGKGNDQVRTLDGKAND